MNTRAHTIRNCLILTSFKRVVQIQHHGVDALVIGFGSPGAVHVRRELTPAIWKTSISEKEWQLMIRVLG